MSRHRNVRSMNYNDECEGYDDVYGHSVEDDYSISPSDAGFIYDRSRSNPMSAFLHEENDIAEEDENIEDIPEKPQLSDVDEARMLSCVEEIQNVIGDSVPLNVIQSIVIKSGFDFKIALDRVLNENSKIPDETPLANKLSTKRGFRTDPGRKIYSLSYEEMAEQMEVAANQSKLIVTQDRAKMVRTPGDGEADPPMVAARPPTPDKVFVKTINVTKGFEVPGTDSGFLRPTSGVRSRCESPISGRLSPVGGESSPGRRRKAKEDSGLKPPGSANHSRCQSPASGRTTPVREVEGSEKRFGADTPSSKMSKMKIDPEVQYKAERGGTKEQLHMVVIGHVDAGKSTLMGHLLYDLGQVNQKTMHKYETESKKMGKQSFIYAWILDETGEERSRGITMDIGQSKFETETKMVHLLDAPGHKDFIPNMISGATQADVAVLVVDATKGEFETGFESGGQTREHALLVRSLGVSQLAVVVNKLDTVKWSQERFQEIIGKLTTFLKQAGFRDSDVTYIPCSGLAGENLVKPSTNPDLTSWYKGPTLIQVIDSFKTPERPITKPLRLSISDIFKGIGSGGQCVSGRVETGVLQPNDKLLLMPQNESAVARNVQIDDMPVTCAFAGDSVSVTLTNCDPANLAIGFVLCDPISPVPVVTRFEARIVVFNITVPITAGYPVVIHAHSMSEQASIVKLISTLNKSSGEVLKKKPRCLTKNMNAVVEVEASRPVCLELYRDIKELGRFMLRVNGASIAAGLVTKLFVQR